jgi:hypothetical protein
MVMPKSELALTENNCFKKLNNSTSSRLGGGCVCCDVSGHDSRPYEG